MNELDQDISIYLRRVRLMQMLVAGLIMGIVGVSMVLFFGTVSGPSSGAAFVLQCLAAVGVLLTISSTVLVPWSLWRLIHRVPAVIIGPRGVVDRASLLSVGLIPWDEIRGSRINYVRGVEILEIRISDPDAVISRLSLLRRAVVRMNYWFARSPVNVPLALLPIGADDLAAIIESHRPANSRPW